jgi:hypothetical protein
MYLYPKLEDSPTMLLFGLAILKFIVLTFQDDVVVRWRRCTQPFQPRPVPSITVFNILRYILTSFPIHDSVPL